MEEALALSVAGGYAYSPPLPEPKVEGEHTLELMLTHTPTPTPPTKPESEMYTRTGILREWLIAPPIMLGAMPEQEEAYLEHWRQLLLSEERADGERRM